MNRKELRRRVDTDLLKKYKGRLRSAWMQGALVSITEVRRARERAAVARAENLRVQQEKSTAFDTILGMGIRSYQETDYDQLAALYKQSELYGGVFDENRDGKDRLRKRITADSDSILIAEKDGNIVGTVSLIEDRRVAWLFRFCVVHGEEEENITEALFNRAKDILHKKGHRQVLVYTPTDDPRLHGRYERLGMERGGDYTCYWKDI